MDRPKTIPTRTAEAETARQQREDREAAALRDNLRRRKEQARARQAPAPIPSQLPARGSAEDPDRSEPESR